MLYIIGNQLVQTTEELKKITISMHEEAKKLLSERRKIPYDFGTITVYQHGQTTVIKL